MIANRKVAIFVDGGYFIRKVQFFWRKYFQNKDTNTLPPLKAEHCADLLSQLVSKHQQNCERELYRVFYYNAPPIDKQIQMPLPAVPGHNGKPTKNFKVEPDYLFNTELHKLLVRKRKFALRMGKLSKHGEWRINTHDLKDLLDGTKNFEDLTNDNFHYAVTQKGVDSKIGIDVTMVSLNGYADTIILLASDADFVPVAKLARVQGVDVILDAMHGSIDNDLSEHIDGLKSFDIVRLLETITNTQLQERPKWWPAQN